MNPSSAFTPWNSSTEPFKITVKACLLLFVLRCIRFFNLERDDPFPVKYQVEQCSDATLCIYWWNSNALESVASLDMHENLNQNDLSNYPHLKISASALHI